PGGALEHRRDRALEPLVGIADHQVYPGEPPRHEGAEELQPEGAILTRAHIESEHLALSAGPHAHGAHHRHRYDLSGLAHFEKVGSRRATHTDTARPAAGSETVRPPCPAPGRAGTPGSRRSRQVPVPAPARPPGGWTPPARRLPAPPPASLARHAAAVPGARGNSCHPGPGGL